MKVLLLAAAASAVVAVSASAASTVFTASATVTPGKPYTASFANPATQDLTVTVTTDKVAGSGFDTVRLDNWDGVGGGQDCNEIGQGYINTFTCTVHQAAVGVWRVTFLVDRGKTAASVVVAGG